MIPNRFLSRPQWERKLHGIGAKPLDGKTPLNSAEWWKVEGGFPFTVPIEDDGSCEFWAINKICQQQGGVTPYKQPLDPD